MTQRKELGKVGPVTITEVSSELSPDSRTKWELNCTTQVRRAVRGSTAIEMVEEQCEFFVTAIDDRDRANELAIEHNDTHKGEGPHGR